MTQLSNELWQERRSRIAFTESVECLRWIVDPVPTDIGEDLLVRVMDGKKFSGITCFVQLKSRAQISSKERRATHYRQRIDVAHLLHWEASAVPIVICTWDLEASEGYWITLPDALKDLERRDPRFRRKPRVQVHIPFANATTKAGLARLRHQLAGLCLPAVQRGRRISFAVTFQFPDTPAGRRQRKALDEARATGKAARISAPHIKRFEYTGWSRRLFGEQPAPAEIRIGEFKPASPVNVALRFESLFNGLVDASIPYVQLSVVRMGTEKVLLSNAEQGGAFQVELTIPRRSPGEVQVSITLRRVPTTVAELHAAVRFGASILRGGTLRIVELNGALASEYKITPGRVVGQDLVEVAEKLAVIQQRVGAAGMLRVRRGPFFTREELRDIDCWFSVLTTGRADSKNQVTFTMPRDGVKELLKRADALRREGSAPGDFEMQTTSDEPLRILNVDVPIKSVQRSFKCKLDDENRKALGDALRATPASMPGVRVRLRMTAEEHYPEFVPASLALKPGGEPQRDVEGEADRTPGG